LRQGAAGIAQKALPAVVKILPNLLRDSKSKGSGFVVSHARSETGELEALIVTNSHVAGYTVGFDVILYDGSRHKGKLVGRDTQLDIALVKITLSADAQPLPEAELGDSDALVPGEYAFAIGHPGNLENIVTMGVVSGFIRPLAGGSVAVGDWMGGGGGGGGLTNTWLKAGVPGL